MRKGDATEITKPTRAKFEEVLKTRKMKNVIEKIKSRVKT